MLKRGTRPTLVLGVDDGERVHQGVGSHTLPHGVLVGVVRTVREPPHDFRLEVRDVRLVHDHSVTGAVHRDYKLIGGALELYIVVV